MTTPNDYFEIASSLVGDSSDAIFQALMIAHQDGRLAALESVAASVKHEIVAVDGYRSLLKERFDAAEDQV